MWAKHTVGILNQLKKQQHRPAMHRHPAATEHRRKGWRPHCRCTAQTAGHPHAKPGKPNCVRLEITYKMLPISYFLVPQVILLKHNAKVLYDKLMPDSNKTFLVGEACQVSKLVGIIEWFYKEGWIHCLIMLHLSTIKPAKMGLFWERLYIDLKHFYTW